MESCSPLPTPILPSVSQSEPLQLTLEHFLITPDMMCTSTLSSNNRPLSMPECHYTHNSEDCPLVCESPSLRRRSHIRRPYGARNPHEPFGSRSAAQRSARRVSAPAAPKPIHFLVQDPSSSQSQVHQLVNSTSPPSATTRRQKPSLSPIVTSDLIAIPKKKFVVQTESHRQTSTLATPAYSSKSKLPLEGPPIMPNKALSLERSASQAVPHPRRSLRGPRPIPSRERRSNLKAAAAQTHSGVPTVPQAAKKTTSDSMGMSPVTIWSQDSAMHTGVPPSRHTSWFFTITSPTDIGDHGAVNRLHTPGENDGSVDWSAIEELLRETVIIERPSISNRGGSDDSIETLTEDDSSSGSAASTPATALPTKSLPDGKRDSSRTDGSNNVITPVSAVYEGKRPLNSRYGGPWGHATQPAKSPGSEGGSETVGDLLIQRWARAQAAMNAAAVHA